MPDLHALLRASLLTAVLSGMVAAPPVLAGALPQTQEVSTGLWVQVGRFARPEAPAEIGAKLGALPKDQTAAWQLLVMPTKDPDVQRVLVGPFGAQADAQHARALINEALKLDAAVLSLKGAAPARPAAKAADKGKEQMALKPPKADKSAHRPAPAREHVASAKTVAKTVDKAPAKDAKGTRHADADAHQATAPKPMRSTPVRSHPGAAAVAAAPAPTPAATPAATPAPKPAANPPVSEPHGAAERVAAARAAKADTLPAPTATASTRSPRQVSGTVAVAAPPSAPSTQPAAVAPAAKPATPGVPSPAAPPKAPLRPSIPGASGPVAGVRNL